MVSASDIVEIANSLARLDVIHQVSEISVMINRDSMVERFGCDPDAIGKLPEDGAYAVCRRHLQEDLKRRIFWSKLNDDWMIVDYVI